MQWVILAFVLLLLLLGAIVFVMWKMSQGRTLQGASLAKIRNAWAQVEKISDPARRVMDADKVVDAALLALGYQGTLGDKLKKAGPRFSDLNGLWNAHKLRNTLAHELHASLAPGDADRAMRAFKKALGDLGM